jgi:hypothetical protein
MMITVTLRVGTTDERAARTESSSVLRAGVGAVWGLPSSACVASRAEDPDRRYTWLCGNPRSCAREGMTTYGKTKGWLLVHQ